MNLNVKRRNGTENNMHKKHFRNHQKLSKHILRQVELNPVVQEVMATINRKNAFYFFRKHKKKTLNNMQANSWPFSIHWRILLFVN